MRTSRGTFGVGTSSVANRLASGLAALVHSNVLVSLSAASVAVTTMVLLGLPLDPLPPAIVFAIALFGYSFNRLTDREEDATNLPDRTAFVDRYGRALFAVGAVAYVAVVAAAVALDLPGAPLLLVPAAAAVVYSVGRAKRMLLVKNLIVGVTWGGIPLGVAVYYGVPARPGLFVTVGVVVVLLTVAAAVFDVKDVAGDRAAGIRTLPVVFGPRATRIAAATVALAVVPVVVAAAVAIATRYLLLLAFVGYVLAYVPFATTDRGPLFYGFVVDGEHLFVAGLALAVRLL